MKRCKVCNKEEALPFRCKFCGEIFCYDHRLPENHNCPGLSRVRNFLGEKIIYDSSKLEVETRRGLRKRLNIKLWHILLMIVLALMILRIFRVI